MKARRREEAEKYKEKVNGEIREEKREKGKGWRAKRRQRDKEGRDGGKLKW